LAVTDWRLRRWRLWVLALSNAPLPNRLLRRDPVGVQSRLFFGLNDFDTAERHTLYYVSARTGPSPCAFAEIHCKAALWAAFPVSENAPVAAAAAATRCAGRPARRAGRPSDEHHWTEGDRRGPAEESKKDVMESKGTRRLN